MMISVLVFGICGYQLFCQGALGCTTQWLVGARQYANPGYGPPGYGLLSSSLKWLEPNLKNIRE